MLGSDCRRERAWRTVQVDNVQNIIHWSSWHVFTAKEVCFGADDDEGLRGAVERGGEGKLSPVNIRHDALRDMPPPLSTVSLALYAPK